MKKLLILLAILLLIPSLLLATEEWPVKSHVFDNNLKLLVLEDHSTPAITFQVWFHVGSKNERPGITGISHLCEHLYFMGTDKYGKEEYSQIIQKHGGLSNAGTIYDYTMYYASIGKDELELIADLESDRMQNLKISQEAFDSEKQVVIEERGYRVDNSPFGDVIEQLFANTWIAASYGWNVVGWRADLEAITLQDCLNYYDIYYGPSNATIVVVGDVKTKDVIKLVDKYFGHIPGKSHIPRPVYNEPEQRGERRIDFHKVSQVPIFIAGYHTPPDGHADSYALDILSRILSGGESSRAYRKLVYDEQIAMAAGGVNTALEMAGIFYAYGVMQPGISSDSGEVVLYAEIERLKNETVSEEELQKAKNQIESSFFMGIQSNSDKASRLGATATTRGNYTLLFSEAEKYNAVTAEDIMRVAKEYLNGKNRTVITVIQEQQAAGVMGL